MPLPIPHSTAWPPHPASQTRVYLHRLASLVAVAVEVAARRRTIVAVVVGSADLARLAVVPELLAEELVLEQDARLHGCGRLLRYYCSMWQLSHHRRIFDQYSRAVFVSSEIARQLLALNLRPPRSSHRPSSKLGGQPSRSQVSPARGCLALEGVVFLCSRLMMM